MKCPTCLSRTRVLETRGKRRRRQCGNGHFFWTVETVGGGQSTGLGAARTLIKRLGTLAADVQIDVARAVLREKGYLR